MNIARFTPTAPLSANQLATLNRMASSPSVADNEPVDQVTLSHEALNVAKEAPAAPQGMEQMPEARLPEAAHNMLEMIHAGKRFSFTRNGITFHNKEKILPAQPDGYYKEYTVRERGKTGRGKARMVTGNGGELYFTTNHYKAFRWVVRAGSPPPNQSSPL